MKKLPNNELGTPSDWIRLAKSDLSIAKVDVKEDILIETLCYHLQQCAEKALKAVLLKNQVRFPLTHDLATLVTLIRNNKIFWEDELDEVVYWV